MPLVKRTLDSFAGMQRPTALNPHPETSVASCILRKVSVTANRMKTR